ncbi:unnamed protein product, partial [Ectocarpus fasciculatus]
MRGRPGAGCVERYWQCFVGVLILENCFGGAAFCRLTLLERSKARVAESKPCGGALALVLLKHRQQPTAKQTSFAARSAGRGRKGWKAVRPLFGYSVIGLHLRFPRVVLVAKAFRLGYNSNVIPTPTLSGFSRDWLVAHFVLCWVSKAR